MKKEHTLVIIIGLFLFSYVLEAVVNPLALNIPTPFHYLSGQHISTYPFTTALIVIRAIGIFLTPLLLMSFWEANQTAKGGILLVLIALMQLYALQDVATKAAVVPLEWSLAISMAGLALILPMIAYFILGGLSGVHKGFGGQDEEEGEE